MQRWTHCEPESAPASPPACGCGQGVVNQLTRSPWIRVDTSRTVNGKHTSLKEVGYEWVAQDDGWQQCKSPPPACTAPRGGLEKCGPHKGTGGFHADDGTPQLDMKKFPNLRGAVSYAHSHGLKANWYFNNCYW